MSTSTPTKKIQKFGTQVAKSKVIYCFTNGDKHHKGVKLTLRANKTFEQILQDMTSKVGVPTGAVRQVFTHDGKPIKSVEAFEDGEKYVCCGAEKFNKAYSITNPEEEKVEEKPKEAPSPVKKTITPKKKPIAKFGTQTEVAKKIRVYRNGDRNHEGVQITVHPTKYKTFEQLKEALTNLVKLPTGVVMKLYTPEGKAVKDLDGLEMDGRYVAVGADAFDKDNMPTAIFEDPEEKKEEHAAPAPAEKTTPKKPIVSAYAKPVTKFGTQTEKAKVIHVFRNGDKHHQGVKMTIHPNKYKNMEQVFSRLIRSKRNYGSVLGAMTKEVGVPTGPVLKVCNVKGKALKDMKEFEDEERYICCGAEKFNKENIPSAIFEDPEEKKEESPAPAPSEKTTPKKPIVSAYAKPVTKFGTQTEKAKVIHVFRNGDKHHKGETLTVHEKKYKNFEQLLAGMTKEVQLPTGPVLKVFSPDGKAVKSLTDVVDGGKYICCGAEPLKKSSMPLAIHDDGEEKREEAPAPSPVKKPERKPVEKKPITKNGDKNHEGEKMTIHSTKYKTFEQVMAAMTKTVHPATGAVRQVFTFEGKVVKSLNDFQTDGVYIAAGAEGYKRDLVHAIKLAKSEKSKPEKEGTSKEPKESSPRGDKSEEGDEGDTKQEEERGETNEDENGEGGEGEGEGGEEN